MRKEEEKTARKESSGSLGKVETGRESLEREQGGRGEEALEGKRVLFGNGERKEQRVRGEDRQEREEGKLEVEGKGSEGRRENKSLEKGRKGRECNERRGKDRKEGERRKYGERRDWKGNMEGKQG